MTEETTASFESLYDKLQRMRDNCLWGEPAKMLEKSKFTDEEKARFYGRLVDQGNMCVLMQDFINQHVENPEAELYFPD